MSEKILSLQKRLLRACAQGFHAVLAMTFKDGHSVHWAFGIEIYLSFEI